MGLSGSVVATAYPFPDLERTTEKGTVIQSGGRVTCVSYVVPRDCPTDKTVHPPLLPDNTGVLVSSGLSGTTRVGE